MTETNWWINRHLSATNTTLTWGYGASLPTLEFLNHIPYHDCPFQFGLSLPMFREGTLWVWEGGLVVFTLEWLGKEKTVRKSSFYDSKLDDPTQAKNMPVAIVSVSQQFRPLGMASGSIPNSAVTASSVFDRYHAAWRARLKIGARGGYRAGWSARVNNRYQWLQIDFRRAVKVKAVATQGRGDLNQYVTRYYLSYGFDGVHFAPYLCRKVRMGL